MQQAYIADEWDVNTASSLLVVSCSFSQQLGDEVIDYAQKKSPHFWSERETHLLGYQQIFWYAQILQPRPFQ